MLELLKKSLSLSISYSQFISLMQHLAVEGGTSGNEQGPDQIRYTKLNASRIKRLDKTLQLSPDKAAVFKNISPKQVWLVIVETWCGDAAQTLPVLNLIAETSPAIELRIVFRDSNPELMNAFLTNGTRSTPKLIILNSELEVLDTWGPRTAIVAKQVEEYKQKYGKIDAEFKEELQKWYNNDKGITISQELLMLSAVCVDC